MPDPPDMSPAMAAAAETCGMGDCDGESGVPSYLTVSLSMISTETPSSQSRRAHSKTGSDGP
eukprot:CAMPEP_0114571920 /NCGR_PEP_ID=MMETSP0114-20121206/17996_1 /TAXON_ID=31324 /ORGANISM="Goniomonas sp, Strain m" /LENGTH=61 /DNA_ID=CAMNT_0001759057 /DNA_START=462 /DNA_END=647 /DNA_ORIENTATION=+